MPVTVEEVEGLLAEAEAPVTAAEVEGLLEQGEIERDERVRGLLTFGASAGPAEHRAEVLELARRSRIPADIVEARLTEVKSSWAAAQLDPRAWRRDNPELEGWLLDNPAAAPVVTQDQQVPAALRALRKLDVLVRSLPTPSRGLEAAARGEFRAKPELAGEDLAAAMAEASRTTVPVEVLQDATAAEARSLRGLARARVGWMAFQAGQQQQDYARLGFSVMTKALAGVDAWDDEKRLADMEPQLLPRDYGSGPWEHALLVEPAQMAASQVEVLKGGGAGAAVGGALGAVAGGAIGRSPAAVKTGARLGARFGAKAGATSASFVLEAGSSFPEFRRERTDDGSAITTMEAAGAAIVYGAAAAGIEGLSFGATEEGAKAVLKGLMKQDGGRALLRRVATAWTKKSASEGLEEFLQTVAQDVTGYMTRTLSAGAVQTADPVATIAEGLDAARVAATSAAMLGAAGPVVTLATARRRREATMLDGRRVAKIAEMSGTPSARADPEGTARAIAEATAAAGEAVTSLHVDAAALIDVFERAEVDADRAVVELLGQDGPAQLREALASGTKIEVPVAAYLERWGSSDAGKALLDHTATRPDRETVAELRERRALPEQIAEDAQALVKQWEAEGAPVAASEAEARLVDAVGRQLAATGVYTEEDAGTAVLPVRAFLRTQAERFGVAPDELFRGYAIAVDRSLEPARTAPVDQDPLAPEVEAPPVDVEEVPFDIDLPEEAGARPAVREVVSRLPAELRLAEVVKDRITGLLNKRGLEAAKPDPTREHLAQFDVAGGKWLNDKHGHATLDGALRVMAAAMQRAGIRDGAKLGGSLWAWVRNPSQANRIAREMQRALGGALRVTTATAIRAENLNATMEVAGGRHDTIKAREIDAGRLPKRGERPETLAAEGEEKLVKQLQAAGPVEVPLAESVRSAAEDVEDQFAAVYEDTVAGEATGLWTADGWVRARDVAPKSFVASADMRGLRAMNEAFGKLATNQILLAFSRAIAQIGGQRFDAAHPHGDEFFAQAMAWAELNGFFSDLEKAADRLVFYMERPDGSVVLQVGVKFAYGIGQTEDQADRVELPAAKARQGDVAAPRVLTREEAAEELGRLEEDPSFVIRRLDAGGGEAHAGGEAQAPGSADPGLRPSAQSIADARDYVSRLRNPEKKAEAAAWLEWALSEEPASKQAPVVRPEIERALGALGVVNPIYGFSFEESGRSMARGVGEKGRRGRSEQPDALREYQERRRLSWNIGGPTRYQGGDVGRGYVQRLQSGAQNLFRVVLQEKADLSTFLHESAHIFMDLLGDLAERPDAPEQVRNDWAAALEWMGAKDRASLTREQAEKWAKAFEVYLMGGDPPSGKLRSAFQTFKRWVVRAYESLASVGEPIDDTIRGIFDRMLVVDRELRRSRERMRIQPLWRSAEDGGMTAEQWADYLREQEMATSHAERQVELRAAKDQLRRQESAWKEERAKLKDAAIEEFDQRQDARTRAYIYQGKMDQGRGVVVDVGRVSINRESVEAIVGADEAKRIFGNHLVKDPGGESPDAVADLFGYPTAEAMIRALSEIPDRNTWAEQRAEAQMAELHPDITADVARLREVVEKGLQGDFTLKWLLREWRALRAKTGERGEPPLAAVRRAAITIAAKRQIGALDPGRAIAAQGRAAEKATIAAARGDFAQAYTLQQQRLLNHYLFRELDAARDERESFLELAGDLRKEKARGRLGKAAPSWRDATDQLLEAAELRKPIPRTEAPASLDQAILDLERYGITVSFDADPLRELLANPKPWRELTVDQMRNLQAALSTFRGAASTRNTVVVGMKRMEREIVQRHLVAEATAALKKKSSRPSSKSARTWRRRFGDGIAGMDGSLLNPEAMILWLGGDSLDSWWHTAIMQPLQDAKARYSDLLKAAVKPITDAFENIPPEVRRRLADRIDGAALFPEHTDRIQAPTTRFELLMLALNAGNLSNMERLTEGRNITPEQVQRAINTLSKEEMDWVQAVWDAFETMRPEAFALEERDTGIRPRKIEPMPVTLRVERRASDGGGVFAETVTYRGGYFPAVYDRHADPVGELQAAKSAGDIFDPAFVRPATAKSHLKARATHYSGVISLDPGHLYQHLAQVAHDIAYREPLRSAANILMDPEVHSVIQERLGLERADVWMKWLQDVGRMRGAQLDQSMRRFNEVVRTLRGNAARALLGWSPAHALADLSNIGVAATVIKPRHIASALATYLRHPLQVDKMVAELSGEVRQRRDKDLDRFRRQMKRLVSQGPLTRGPMAWIIDHSFFFQQAVDRLTSVPIWLGAYRQALAKNESEDAAIRFANLAVRNELPSSSAIDQAAILRDPGYWGISTLFYGYLSKLYQKNRNIIQPLLEAENVGDAAKALPRITGRLMALAIAGNVIPELIMGRGPEEDEEWSQWFTRKLLLAPLQTLPVPVAPMVESMLLNRRPSVRAAPGYAFLDELGRAGWRALKDDDGAKVAIQIAKAAGLIVGVPTRPATVQGAVAVDVLSGKSQPRDLAEWMSAAIWGKREKQPLNPITAVKRALEP